MKTRTMTDDEMKLIYYFHYISPIKYSISELTTLFNLSKRSIYNYLNEMKRKIDKDDTLVTNIINKFRDFENITEYKKDLKEDIDEFSYIANVQKINKRLIEIDKKIEYLKLNQPVNSNIDIILQSIASKVDKIPEFVKIVSAVLKDISSRINEVKINQENTNLINKLDELNTKVDQLFMYFNDYEEDLKKDFLNSYSQPSLQLDNSHKTIHKPEALKFG